MLRRWWISIFEPCEVLFDRHVANMFFAWNQSSAACLSSKNNSYCVWNCCVAGNNGSQIGIALGVLFGEFGDCSPSFVSLFPNKMSYDWHRKNVLEVSSVVLGVLDPSKFSKMENMKLFRLSRFRPLTPFDVQHLQRAVWFLYGGKLKSFSHFWID